MQPRRAKAVAAGAVLLAAGVFLFVLMQSRQKPSRSEPKAPLAAMPAEAVAAKPPYPAEVPPDSPQVSRSEAGVFYRLGVSRAVYGQGEPVVMELMVDNRTAGAISFATRQHLAGPSFCVLRGEEMVWAWPALEHLPVEPCREWFGPGLAKIYRLRWDQKDQAGRIASPGNYVLVATFPPLEARKGEHLQRVEMRVQFSIQEAQGPIVPDTPRQGTGTRLETDKSEYAPSETVKLRLTIVNESNSPLVFRSSSGQRFDFVVRCGEREVWRWSRGRVFTMMLTSWEIPPGESVTYGATWNQRDDSGQPVPPGHYVVEGWQIGGGRAQAEFTIH